jgi:hypothetical protein
MAKTPVEQQIEIPDGWITADAHAPTYLAALLDVAEAAQEVVYGDRYGPSCVVGITPRAEALIERLKAALGKIPQHHADG